MSVVDRTIEAAIAALRRGGLVLVTDDADRENEGDFVGAADAATAAALALVVRHSTGIVCVPLPAPAAAALHLPLMVPANEDPFRTAFTVTVDYRHGTTTGVSATDRAATIRALARGVAGGESPDAFSRPGHVFPLIARDGGVLARGGHTEASLDLVLLAGRCSAAYIAEVVSDEPVSAGGMAHERELVALAATHSLPLVSIADLQRFRYRREVLVALEESVSCCGAFEDASTSEKLVSQWGFRSLWMKGVRYDASVWVKGKHLEGNLNAGGRHRSSSALITFDAVEGSNAHVNSVAAALCALKDDCLVVAVRVMGAPWKNVAQPPGGDAVCEGAAKPPFDCYSHLYPAPSFVPPPHVSLGGCSIDVAGEVSPIAEVCDRVCAEAAQVIAAVLRCAAVEAVQAQMLSKPVPLPAFPRSTWAYPEGANMALREGVSEADALAASSLEWPVVGTLLVPPVQPVPRIWAFGVSVSTIHRF